jgi:ribosome-binding protein aMBF1 (putative translation factor)
MPPRRSIGSAYASRYRQFLRLLRATRRRAGLTQVAVARALGRPQSFVAKCESGERRVDIIELDEFAKLYGTTVMQCSPFRLLTLGT